MLYGIRKRVYLIDIKKEFYYCYQIRLIMVAFIYNLVILTFCNKIKWQSKA